MEGEVQYGSVNKLFELIKTGNGWIRLVAALVIGTFVAGMYWSNLKYTLSSHEKRITEMEFVVKEVHQINARLFRIEGALSIDDK